MLYRIRLHERDRAAIGDRIEHIWGPGRQHHSDIGQPLSNCLSEHQPIHLRHDDIGEDQIDVQSGADHPQGFHAGRCRQHVAAEVLTYETRGRFHRTDIVIDNEDDESSERLVSAHRSAMVWDGGTRQSKPPSN